MPRVNRDLQRRMEERRARDRRRTPAQRQYRFTPQPAAPEDGHGDEGAETARPQRPSRPFDARHAQAPARAPRPFSSYGADYAYVFGDLRRISAVVGVLLLLLLALYFVLR